MGVFRKAPPGYLRAQFQRQLLPGAVIKLEELMDDGKVHEKRFVVVSVDPTGNTVCFVINSVIGPFIQNRPNILKCQAAMDLASHPFMLRDSHVNCYEGKSYATSHVLDEMVNGTGFHLGKITLPLRDEITKRLLQSVVTSAQEKMAYCQALATLV